jgi:hypothetical protein
MASVPTDVKKTVHAFNKLLKASSSKSKIIRDTDDGIKKLSNLILVEGVPANAVSEVPFIVLMPLDLRRIQPSGLAFGKFYFMSTISTLKNISATFPRALAKSETKYVMTPFGRDILYLHIYT